MVRIPCPIRELSEYRMFQDSVISSQKYRAKMNKNKNCPQSFDPVFIITTGNVYTLPILDIFHFTQPCASNCLQQGAGDSPQIPH